MRRPHTKRRDLVDVAMGRKPADKVIQGGKLVNVFTKEIYSAGVAIVGDRIAAIGDVARCVGPQTEIIDATGRYLVPGLVEPHLHEYHSYTNPLSHAEALLMHGTTAVADGFYGPGIVGGVQAIRFFLDAFKKTPLKVIFSLPTLAYLQNRELGIPPAPNSVSAEQMMSMLDWEETIGLEEPPYLPITEKDEIFLDLYERAIDRRLPITGHAAGISIPGANAYAAAGTVSDHESTDAWEAVEKARLGLRQLLRQGSGCFDVRECIKAITEHGLDARSFSFCADVAAPEKLYYQGDIDECIRVAIAAGLDPVTAIQMGTINAAEVYHLELEVGAIAPGRLADILFVRDLRDFDIKRVMANGEVVVEEGKFLPVLAPITYPDWMYGTVKLERPLTANDFQLRVEAHRPSVQARVIGVTDLSLYTREEIVPLAVKDGSVQPVVEHDILRIAMVDRHNGTGQVGNGFVRGYGLKRGAIASSVNAVCENIVVVGTNPEDMAVAANHLARIGGGKVVVADGQVLAEIPLPLLGLFSAEPLEVVVGQFNAAYAAIRQLGCDLSSPFSTMEFCCACGEIGKIKIYHQGLIDVDAVRKVPVIVE